jgi:hypothetical protein
MKEQVKILKRKIKALESKAKIIEDKNPTIKFYTSENTQLRNDLNKHFEITKELIFLKVDLKFCPTENRNEMCFFCSCWKSKIV